MIGFLAAFVSDIRPAIGRRIGVENLAIVSGVRNAKAVAFADDRRGIDNHNHEVVGVLAAADKRKDAVVSVVGVNPFKSVPIEIDLMKGRFGGVNTIEVAHEMLNAAMLGVFQNVPFKAMGFGPFRALGKLLSHEEEFLAGMSVL